MAAINIIFSILLKLVHCFLCDTSVSLFFLNIFIQILTVVSFLDLWKFILLQLNITAVRPKTESTQKEVGIGSKPVVDLSGR